MAEEYENYTDEFHSVDQVRVLIEMQLKKHGIASSSFFGAQGFSKNTLWNMKETYPNSTILYCVSRVTNKSMDYYLSGKYSFDHYFDFMEQLERLDSDDLLEALVMLRKFCDEKKAKHGY